MAGLCASPSLREQSTTAVCGAGAWLSGPRPPMQPMPPALSGTVLPGPLEAMNLTLSGLTGEPGRQASLFPEVRQRERLREALAQLEALEGHKPIYRLREVEPWSRIPERRMAFAPCDS